MSFHWNGLFFSFYLLRLFRNPLYYLSHWTYYWPAPRFRAASAAGKRGNADVTDRRMDIPSTETSRDGSGIDSGELFGGSSAKDEDATPTQAKELGRSAVEEQKVRVWNPKPKLSGKRRKMAPPRGLSTPRALKVRTNKIKRQNCLVTKLHNIWHARSCNHFYGSRMLPTPLGL